METLPMDLCMEDTCKGNHMHGETATHEKKLGEIPVHEQDVHQVQPEGIPAPEPGVYGSKEIFACEPGARQAEAPDGEDDHQVTHVQ